MATYVNNLRLKEIATGDESGTWGTSTNTNLELIGQGLGYGTKQMSADSNETFTMADGGSDPTRAFYLKVTSAVSLTTTRTLTLAPNTISKIWIIENATSGAQSLSIKQGSGNEVTIATGKAVILYTDGAGATGAVNDALQFVDVGDGTVTSVGGTGTVNGLTLSGTVTSSGDLTLGGTLANVDLAAAVTGTLPVANGGTGATTITANSVVIGSGTSALSSVAPSTSGNVLTSTGSAWASSAPTGQPDPTLTGVNLSVTAGTFVVATAGSITITLPSGPSAGDFVIVKDGTGAAATTSFAVARNGSNIASAASDLTFDKNFAEITMTYIDGTIGWSV